MTELFRKLAAPLFILILISAQNITSQTFDCLDCHENLIMKSVHFEAIDCQDCHSDVEDEAHVDSGAAKVDCSVCHSEYSELVKVDIHHRLNVKNKPSCISCHGDHNIISPASVRNKTKTYCATCHQNNIVLATSYHTALVSNNTCTECHETEDHSSQLVRSVHSNLQCADCHNYISNNLADHPENITKSQKADCYLCHSEIAKEHRESIHGISLIEGVDEAAHCWDCHGSHEILRVADPNSSVQLTRLPETCGTCHDDKELIEKYNLSPVSPSKSYTHSVHGKIVMEGGSAASCTSCHGVHNIKNRVQENSTISTFGIPNTCGQCHAKITEEFQNSIHWIKAKQGARLAPVCTDCHSEHEIASINGSAKAKHESRRLQQETCFQCHQNPMVARGRGGQVISYLDSYHGLAVIRGDERAAACVDCHNVHDILPSSHPNSSVHSDKVAATCQTCHPGASEVFSKSYSHFSQSEQAAKIENWIETIYFWLIVLIIGGMILHNLLIFVDEIKAKRKKESGMIRVPRFTTNEVIQHILLFVSFITLAITGFALKYPLSWWAEGLYALGLSEPVRQIIHRTAGTIMLALGLYHIIYLLATERGREVLLNLLPNISDVRTAVYTMMYYLRLTKEKPEFDKYDYAEKAEYWALIWGTIVMGVTGLILWFPTVVGDWAPVWFIKVAEIVHFYEAILASLAILVWHWFFVIYRPSEYPMSFVWVDGKMTLKNYKHHHKKHFKRVALEVLKIKYGTLDIKKASNFTKLFIKTMGQQNHDAFEVIREQMEEDEGLRIWLEERVENNSKKEGEA